MANVLNKKKLQKQNDFFLKQNKKLYVRMRELEAKLDAYEKNVAAQVAVITSRYEGMICYLIDRLGWDGVWDSDVADWAAGKAYAIKAKTDDECGLFWESKVYEVKDEDAEQEQEQVPQ